MQRTYYIDKGIHKDGPHDLVTIMHRIRNKKISGDTPIYIDDAAIPTPAAHISEIAIFFHHTPQASAAAFTGASATSLLHLLATGWRFISENNIITVFAGAMLLISFLLTVGLMNRLGWFTGGVAGWCILVLLHNIYLICTLRMYRGQTVGPDFIDHHLAPILLSLAIASVVLALMMVGGALLLIIPAVIISTLYIFVPFLMLDHRYSMIEAMHASRLLLQKRGKNYARLISILVVLHLLCLMLIIPVPLTLPLFAIALAELYEEISTS